MKIKLRSGVDHVAESADARPLAMRRSFFAARARHYSSQPHSLALLLGAAIALLGVMGTAYYASFSGVLKPFDVDGELTNYFLRPRHLFGRAAVRRRLGCAWGGPHRGFATMGVARDRGVFRLHGRG